MANTLRFKRGLVSGIPTAALGEPLFTTDTFDLYIGNGTGNTRFQKYIASGTTSQLLRGDGSLLTMPIVLTSPSNGQVLKYDGTNWVNSADAGVTGSGTTNYLSKWTSSSALGNSLVFDNGTNVLINTTTALWSAASRQTFEINGAAQSLLALNVANTSAGYLWHSGTYLSLANTRNSFISFVTNSAEYMRLHATGNLSLNSTTDNGQRLQVTGTSYFSDNIGLGVSNSAARLINIGKNISGSTIAFGIAQVNNVASDVTNSARIFYSEVGTQAATFTLSELNHYYAVQGTFGAGSAVTSQYGFRVFSNLTGATSNYGFFGDIASGTGRWNLYMNGTANNYMAGSLGIGSTSLTGYSLRVNKAIEGALSSTGIYQDGTVQSTVTSNVFGHYNSARTQAASFTLSNYYHYYADQFALGAGSSITNQYGYVADSTLTGATNNFGFYGNIASGTGRWNLYMNGSANNYLAGSLGIGATSGLGDMNVRITKALAGSVFPTSVYNGGTIAQAATTGAVYFLTDAATENATFTLPNLYHYWARQGTFGASSTVTNQYGFFVDSSLTGATNDYGFYGNIASGTGRWNLYMNGTAANYLAGSLGIGTTSITGNNLTVIKNITGGTTAFNIQSAGVIQSDVTGYASYYRAVASTQATTFTLSTLANFSSGTGAFGAGSTTTNFIGFHAQPMTGGTNNYGFYGEVASGTGRWNLYMVGSAHNYLANNLGINNTTPLTKLHISAGHIFANNGTGVNGGANIYLGSNDFNNSTFWDSAPGIGAVYSATSAVASDLGFYTYAGNANSRNERMRIFYSGNIGINTTTDAGFRLDVNGTMRAGGNLGGANQRVANFRNSGGNGYIEIQGSGSVAGQIISDATGQLYFTTNATAGTAGTTRMFISSSGDVSINTLTPNGYKFRVNGTSYFDDNLRFPNAKGVAFVQTGGSLLGSISMDTANQVTIDNNGFAGLSVGGSYTMTGGNLGIGQGGSAFGSGTRVISVVNGTAPTSSVATSFLMYSANVTTGNAAPHFRTENGAVIKLYQETTAVGNAIISLGGGNAVLDDTTFDGYTLRQIVRALRNQGILQ